MSEVVLINPFVVPEALRSEFLAKYHAVIGRLSQQPGFLGGGLHQAADRGRARFQFVNVNRWVSADALRRHRRREPDRGVRGLDGSHRGKPGAVHGRDRLPPIRPLTWHPAPWRTP